MPAPIILAPPEKVRQLAEMRRRRRELAEQKRRRESPKWATPGDLARAVEPLTVQTPALDVIDDALVWAYTTPGARLLISMPPQEGKSQRATKTATLWALTRNPDLRVGIASYAQGLAETFGREIRNWITTFDGTEGTLDLGLRLAPDYGSARRWQLDGRRGGVVCVGIGSGLTGRPLDCVSGDTHIECEYGHITAAEAFRRGITRILAYDHDSGRAVWRAVEAARRIRGRRVVEVVTTAGRTVTCTPDHRVYTRRGYVAAGSLRPGDSLVAVMGDRGMPMRRAAPRAEDGVAEGDPSRPGALLQPGLHGGNVLGNAEDPVLRLRRVHSAQSPVNVLRRVRPGTQAASRAHLPSVFGVVPAPVVAHDVLLAGMRGSRPLGTHDRERKLALQDRHQLRPLVPVDETTDPAARRHQVRGVRSGPNDDLRAWRQDGAEIRSRRPSHQRGRAGQPAAEPDHAVLGLPRRASQVEEDTVALVRDRGSDAVDVYDFQVAGTHNFFGNGVLVHNCLVIDDPFADKEQADSKYYRDRVWDWWQSVGAPRLAPDAPVIVILTRWHEDDIAGRLTGAEDGHRWRVINIPALADHDPAKGETDPLGREPGQWLESARGRTVEQWEQIRIQSGVRVFTALYQGRPSPDTGNVWLRHWWRRYETPLWSQHPTMPGAYRVNDCDEVLMSWDMAFADTKGSDFVAGQVWARRGADVFLLDQVHKRLSFTDTITAFLALCARWPQANRKLVENKANGPAVISTLKSKIPGIVPITPTESKYARAVAVAPFVEAGNAFLPAAEIALFDTEAYVAETTAFPNDAHDDQVDATSQALRELLLDGTGAMAWIEWARQRAAEAAARNNAATLADLGGTVVSGLMSPPAGTTPQTADGKTAESPPGDGTCSCPERQAGQPCTHTTASAGAVDPVTARQRARNAEFRQHQW